MAHPEQLAFCQTVKDKYPDYFHQVRVLDVGSLNINGSNVSLFTDVRYFGVDVAAGRNVDIVTPAHQLQLPDATFDVVISTECFEHDRHIAETIGNIYRMLRPGGLFLFSCATEGRKEHGTRATTPEDAPLLQSMGDWADYYQNVTEAMVRRILDVDACFSEYCFSTNEATHDLYFYGIRTGPRPLSKETFEPQPGLDELHHRLLKQTEINRTLVQELEIQKCVEAVLRSDLKAQEARLAMLRVSTSWKVTTPLRLVRRAALGEWRQLGAELNRYLDDGGAGGGKLPGPLRAMARGVASLQERTRSARSAEPGPRAFTILTPPHTEYVAHCLALVLREESFAVTIASRYDASSDQGQRFLVICPQVYSALPHTYYAFQMEQTVNPRWFTRDYFGRLHSAEAILDYSRSNLELLHRLGFAYQKTFYVPILPTSKYAERLVGDFGYRAFPRVEQSSEVVFYGDPNCPRRLEILAALRRHFEVRVVSEVFGQELVEILRSARVVVNIHYYEGALLETTRLSEAISLGIPVVSEEGVNPEEYQEFRQWVDFVPVGDVPALIAAVRRLLDDDQRTAVRRSTIRERANGGMGDLFRRFLFAEGLIPYSSMVEKTSLESPSRRDEATAEFPSYCLTLSETPARRRAFLANRRPEYQLFEGLRHRTGWIGCGLSYKYMFSKLAARQPLVLVCEDDVEFLPEFDRRWASVRAYLRRNAGKWDIFAGLIADVHPDSRVLDVEEENGETFVTIDRMTSMVFNVYAARAMGLIASWDERNTDDRTNTIDRYMQRSGSLRVVTTTPFLVGHTESHESTLWAFQNSHYRGMIQASRELLLEKVNAFRGASPGSRLVGNDRAGRVGADR